MTTDTKNILNFCGISCISVFSVREQNWWAYKDLQLNHWGQGHTEIINACDTMSPGDTFMCQWQERKELWTGHESAQTGRAIQCDKTS